ncbi:hypothetical protein, partial [Butyricicoccus pullicaecorum]|uniref:hypothetical protein n=1 Tax=Butyricicoccus pullicaecorum TaxID=501571 RepID=UPI001A9A3B24
QSLKSPVATGETPLLKPGVRPGFQPKPNNKSRSAERETFRPPFMTWPNKSATALRIGFPFSLSLPNKKARPKACFSY